MSKKIYRIQELKNLCGRPIMIGAIQTLPIIYAIDYGDIQLFRALLDIDIDLEQRYEQESLYDYLIKRMKQHTLAYKAFYKALKIYRVKGKTPQNSSRLSYYLTYLLSTSFLCIAALANFFFISQSSIFSQETINLINLILDNMTTISLLGLSFNVYFLYKKIKSNYGNSVKSFVNQQITLVYDVISFVFKVFGYTTYLFYRLNPVAGILFVFSLAFDNTRLLITLIQTLNHWNTSRKICELNQGIDCSDQEIIRGLRSYQRAYYKILATMARISSSTTLTVTMMAWCFMPLTPLGTLVVVIACLHALLLPSLIKTRIEAFFESRANQQVASYLSSKGKPCLTNHGLKSNCFFRYNDTDLVNTYLTDSDPDLPKNQSKKIAYERAAFFFERHSNPIILRDEESTIKNDTEFESKQSFKGL